MNINEYFKIWENWKKYLQINWFLPQNVTDIHCMLLYHKWYNLISVLDLNYPKFMNIYENLKNDRKSND